MKKMIFCIIPLIMVLMGCVSGETAAVKTNGNSSPGMDLDAAIREASAQMGENLPGGTKVALISVASSSAQLSEYVISRLEAALVSDKRLVVVDRANLDKIREEQGFQASGEVDDDSAKSIGKLLGAGAIVTGAFANLGDVYSLTLKTINIETATVAVSYPADIAKSTRIETLLASGGGGAGTQTSQRGNSGGSTTAPVDPPTQKTLPSPDGKFTVGDTGPAGGIVFYVNPSAGDWKYLEAAPANTEVTVAWASQNFNSREINNKNAVGMGKSNTEYIIKNAGSFARAVTICSNLQVNGYSDWYLPSLDELDLMFLNLHRNGLGGFKNDKYWSSTPQGGYANWIPVWCENFSDGKQGAEANEKNLRVRAVRQF
jgi:hypothetical protein